jgi:hypothetical protein
MCMGSNPVRWQGHADGTGATAPRWRDRSNTHPLPTGLTGQEGNQNGLRPGMPGDGGSGLLLDVQVATP